MSAYPSNILRAAQAVANVAVHPSTESGPDKTNEPIIERQLAITMIIAMIGTATSPLTMALSRYYAAL
jgi:hypothetical protein